MRYIPAVAIVFATSIALVMAMATPADAQSNQGQSNQRNGRLLPPPTQDGGGKQAQFQSDGQSGGQFGSASGENVADVIPRAQMQELFQKMRENFKSIQTNKIQKPEGEGAPTPAQETPQETPSPNTPEQKIGTAPPDTGKARDMGKTSSPKSAQRSGVRGGGDVPLGDVKLRLAYRNMAVEDIMKKVEQEINRQVAGQWALQWRLTEESQDIIEQRVNLNAESTFDEFLSHLTAKINNLTGVRLFVKVFEVSRIIIISDTF